MKKRMFTTFAMIGMLFSAGALVGCNDNKKTFNIEDYAHPLTSLYAKDHLYVVGTESALSEVKEKQWTSFSQIGSGKLLCVVKNGTNENRNRYTIYDAEVDRELYSGIEGYYSKSIYTGVSSATVYVLSSYKTSYDMTYKIIDESGKRLINKDLSELEFNSIEYDAYDYQYHYDENNKRFSVFTINYIADSIGERQTHYFAYYANDRLTKEIDKETLEKDVDGGYVFGDALIDSKRDIYNSKYYPDNKMLDYKYAVSSNDLNFTVRFYENDTKLSEIKVNNGVELGFIGKYYYFYEIALVSSKTSKYNIEIPVDSSTIRANYELFRYDFTNSGAKIEKVKLGDYIIMDSVSMLYNYTSNIFDKMVVSAFKMYDGVAVIGNIAFEKSLIIDSEAKIVYDLTNSDITENIYKLNDNRFYSGNHIVDNKLCTIATLPSNSALWVEEELFRCYENNSQKVFFVDYDGIVRIEPFSGNYKIYGDSIVVTSNTDITVYSKKYYSGTNLLEIIRLRDDEKCVLLHGIILISNENNSTLAVYDLDGRLIKTINNIYDASSFLEVGNKVFLTTKDNYGTSRTWMFC